VTAGGAPARERTPGPLWNVWTVVWVALCAAWYWKRCWLAQMPDRGPSDFEFYYMAASRILHGQSPYVEGGYVYPPLLACLLAPLAGFDYFTARWIWFAVSHAAFLGAGWLLWRRMGGGRTALWIVALVWAAGGATEDGFGLGQVDAVLLLLSVAAITRADGVARLAVAAGGAIKLLPGILAVLERRWRDLAAIAAAAVLLLAVPSAVVRFGLRGPAAPPSTQYLAGTPCLLSWSLPSAALRLLESPRAGGTLPQAWTTGYDLPLLHLPLKERWISAAVAALVLVVGSLAVRRAGFVTAPSPERPFCRLRWPVRPFRGGTTRCCTPRRSRSCWPKRRRSAVPAGSAPCW
jgi:hypothetical protein